MPRTFFQANIPPDVDVLLVMPGYADPQGRRNGVQAARTADLTIRGGHAIRVVGGDNGSGRMLFSGFTGSVFIEGVSFELGPSKDAIDVGGRGGVHPDVYLQNVFVTGVRGTNKGVHADVLQPWGVLGMIRIDRLTADSNYQGLFLANEFGIDGVELRHCDLSYNDFSGDPVTYLLWFGDTTGPASYPVSLSDVWVDPRRGQSLVNSGVFPKAGQAGMGRGPGALELRPSGDAYWDASSRITGRVRRGVPLQGRFVPADIGRNYRSPGYSAP